MSPAKMRATQRRSRDIEPDNIIQFPTDLIMRQRSLQENLSNQTSTLQEGKNINDKDQSEIDLKSASLK